QRSFHTGSRRSQHRVCAPPRDSSVTFDGLLLMKSTRLRKLQLGTATALMLCLGLVIYLFRAMPIGQPMWNTALAERQLKDATAIQELQRDLRSAVSSLSRFRHSRNEM